MGAHVRAVLAGGALAAALALGGASSAHATQWLCRPGVEPDPCRESLATTVQTSATQSHVETPALPGDPPVDCFYVYPTVSDQPRPNATATEDPEEKSIAELQAGRFSQACRVFAPLYRQNTLVSLFTGLSSPTTRALAYADVRSAFEDYLAHDNDGRGIVLIGHSQGAGILRQLMRETFDRDPALRAKLVSAVLLGGNVLVRRGSDRGGDFQNIPLCRADAQAGCVIAYSTFNAPPPDDTRFGRPPAGDQQDEVACVNPASIAANATTEVHPILRGELFAPGLLAAGEIQLFGGVPPTAPTPWLVTPDRYDAQCRSLNGANVLLDTPVGSSRALHPSPDATWGLHIVDVNGALGDLVADVQRETQTYLHPPPPAAPRLTLAVSFGAGRDRAGRACARRDVAVRLTGADRATVTRMDVFVAGRRVVRDRHAPFTARVRRARLRRGGLRAVVAKVTLADGRGARVERRVRACR